MPATPVPAPPDPGPDALAERLRLYAAAARTAPSKHNAQPWRFRTDAQALQVLADRSRLMPATDPGGRELLLACGAAVRAAVVAAAGLGFSLDVTRLPEGPDGPVAVLREGAWLFPSKAHRARADALLRRRTDRGPLDAGAFPPSLPFDVQDAASRHGCVLRLVRSEGERRTLTRLVDLADRQLARRPEVVEEVRSVEGDPATRPDVGITGAPSSPHNSWMRFCEVFAAVSGGAVSHTASPGVSTGTTRPGSRRSRARTARCRGPPSRSGGCHTPSAPGR